MAWGLTTLVIGLLFGWANPVSDDRIRLMQAGTVLGVPVAFGYVMLGAALGSQPLLLGRGFVAGLVTFVLMMLLFLAGTWIGSAIDRRNRPNAPPSR